MKSSARSLTVGLLSSLIFIGACSQDYSKNFKTPNEAPKGSYDVARYEKGVFTGIGWSADKEDGAPLKKVIVYVDGKAVGEAKFVIDRSDVADVYKDSRWLKSGWTISETIPLSKGPHTSLAISYDKNEALAVSQKDFTVE
jgi:hypothetical protein